jgi:hypothetical protein
MDQGLPPQGDVASGSRVRLRGGVGRLPGLRPKYELKVSSFVAWTSGETIARVAGFRNQSSDAGRETSKEISRTSPDCMSRGYFFPE